jgi:hypothetical protein
MRRIAIAIAVLILAACASTKQVGTGATIASSGPGELGATATTVMLTATPPADTQPTDPEQRSFLNIQDRLNVFASPKYLADVQAAKAAGSDTVQNQCMDATVEIGADIKARPLIVIPTADMSNVDSSCGWCVLAAKRKLAADIRGGPSLVTQLADARKRLLALARKGLVGCAPLKEDTRLQLLTPENAVADLLTLLNLFGERQ